MNPSRSVHIYFYYRSALKHSPYKLNKSRVSYNSFLFFKLKVDRMFDVYQVLNHATSLHLLRTLPPGYREKMRRRRGRSAEAVSMRVAQRVEEGKRPPGGAGNGLYPDISQQSFHNSSIFAGRSLTKLVSFRETFQDEIAK